MEIGKSRQSKGHSGGNREIASRSQPREAGLIPLVRVGSIGEESIVLAVDFRVHLGLGGHIGRRHARRECGRGVRSGRGSTGSSLNSVSRVSPAWDRPLRPSHPLRPACRSRRRPLLSRQKSASLAGPRPLPPPLAAMMSSSRARYSSPLVVEQRLAGPPSTALALEQHAGREIHLMAWEDESRGPIVGPPS